MTWLTRSTKEILVAAMMASLPITSCTAGEVVSRPPHSGSTDSPTKPRVNAQVEADQFKITVTTVNGEPLEGSTVAMEVGGIERTTKSDQNGVAVFRFKDFSIPQDTEEPKTAKVSVRASGGTGESQTIALENTPYHAHFRVRRCLLDKVGSACFEIATSYDVACGKGDAKACLLRLKSLDLACKNGYQAGCDAYEAQVKADAAKQPKKAPATGSKTSAAGPALRKCIAGCQDCQGSSLTAMCVAQGEVCAKCRTACEESCRALCLKGTIDGPCD